MIMWKSKFILCFVSTFLVTAVISEQEELDAGVEFSSPVVETLMESPENASIVSADETEVQSLYEKEQQRLATLQAAKNESVEGLNETLAEGAATNATENTTSEAKAKAKIECQPIERKDDEVPTVSLVNSTVLLSDVLGSPAKKNESQNSTAGPCVVVLFYSPNCVFSARMAPYYNALPRVFPDIDFYAVDILETSNNLYIRYGLVYIPNIMLFHNTKPFARYNETTLNLDTFVSFINKYTGLEYNRTLNVTSVDMTGPVSSLVEKKVDYLLILAWAFTLSCCLFGFLNSSFCKKTFEFLRNTWHEANAVQHAHED